VKKPLSQRSFAFWNRMSKRFGTLGFLLTLWGLFFPAPVRVLIPLLALAPVAAVIVARMSGGHIGPADEQPGNTGLVALLVGPPIALALVDLRFFPPIDGRHLMVIGAAAGIVLGSLYFLVRPTLLKPKRPRWWETLIGWVGAACYGWILAAALNGALPQSEPQKFEVPILARYISGGKHISYNLRLPPLGSVRQIENWEVHRNVYSALTVGSHVCVYIYPGALGEPWYDAELCEPSHQLPAS
jgi:hypothetical protein